MLPKDNLNVDLKSISREVRHLKDLARAWSGRKGGSREKAGGQNQGPRVQLNSSAEGLVISHAD